MVHLLCLVQAGAPAWCNFRRMPCVPVTAPMWVRRCVGAWMCWCVGAGVVRGTGVRKCAGVSPVWVRKCGRVWMCVWARELLCGSCEAPWGCVCACVGVCGCVSAGA